MPNLTQAVQEMWDKDNNRSSDYELDLGEHLAMPGQKTGNDEKHNVFKKYSTISHNTSNQRMKAVFDSPNDTGRQNSFLGELVKTRPMEVCRQFVKDSGKISKDDEFQGYLKDIWFSNGGFETIFMGKKGSNQIDGLQNWVRIQEIVKKDGWNGLQYIGALKLGNSKKPEKNFPFIPINFRWNRQENIAGNGRNFGGDGLSYTSSTPWEEGTVCFGTSPEFEMAMYTACFAAGGRQTFNLNTSPQNYRIELDVSGGKTISRVSRFAVFAR